MGIRLSEHGKRSQSGVNIYSQILSPSSCLACIVKFFSGIVGYLRAFLAILWAAIAAADGCGSVVVVRRFEHALKWLSGLFSDVNGKLSASLPHRLPLVSPGVYIITDASLWGGGALFCVGGIVKQRMALRWTNADHRRFNLKPEVSGNISAFEALTL